MNKKLIFLAMPIFILVLSMVLVGCGSAPAASSQAPAPYEGITITVTGDFSLYSGWQAIMHVGEDAIAMPLDVSASTTSLTFTLLRIDNNKPFNTPGTYIVVLWFEKAGEYDADFVIRDESIREGSNTVDFSTFSPW